MQRRQLETLPALVLVLAACGTPPHVEVDATAPPAPVLSIVNIEHRHRPPPHKRRVVAPLPTTTTTRPHATATPTTRVQAPPPTAAPVIMPQPATTGDAFLACTRAHESDTAGGYSAVSPDGVYRGAYQFLPSTWNTVAARAGRPDLVGVDPARAAPGDQDALALALYHDAGAAPWGGRCAGLP